MDILLVPIQTLIYRYIHQDALKRGFEEVFPITSRSEPFSMDKTVINSGFGEIIEYSNFKSEMCKMCYTRNKHSEMWIRCYDILDGVQSFTFIDGNSYEYSYEYSFYSEGGRIIFSPDRRRATIKYKIGCAKDTPQCFFRQMWKLYENRLLDHHTLTI